jgi:hypothetical protein
MFRYTHPEDIYNIMKKQLAGISRERDVAKHNEQCTHEANKRMAKELQHYAQQLRDALEFAFASTLPYRTGTDGEPTLSDKCVQKAEAALSLPHDTSALDAMVKERDELELLYSEEFNRNNALVVELSACEKDAARYRWLRDQAINPCTGLEACIAIHQLDFRTGADDFDATIDVARSEK